MNRGSCLCGAVQFEAGPFDSMVHCHCSMCRKHHGAMFATFLGGASGGFHWLAGEDAVVVYESSAAGLRPFCRHCGSVLPDRPAGTWKCPSSPPEPSRATRTSGRSCTCSPGPAPDWFPITDALPQYERFPPGFGDTAIDRPSPDPVPGTIRGGCLCGEVAFELSGSPERMHNCHCSRCRRARSAAHATNAFFRHEQLAWIRGRIRSRELRAARCKALRPGVLPAAAEAPCPVSSPRPATSSCPAAASTPGRAFRCTATFIVASKAPWFEITDTLPQWEALPA